MKENGGEEEQGKEGWRRRKMERKVVKAEICWIRSRIEENDDGIKSSEVERDRTEEEVEEEKEDANGGGERRIDYDGEERRMQEDAGGERRLEEDAGGDMKIYVRRQRRLKSRTTDED